MSLTKTEVLCEYMTYDGFDGYIWDRWFHWRLEQAGITTPKEERERWKEILHAMPEHYTIDIKVDRQTVEIDYPGGSDVIPLMRFCDEDEDEPNVELVKRGAYWDGPITGTCLYNGVEAYFDMVEEGDLDRNRKYAAYRLVNGEKGEKLGEFYWFHFKHYQQPRDC